MVRYLLGELNEQERGTIEEMFFTDYNYFEELLSVEAALFDDYLAGKLSDSEVERLRTNLLGSQFQLRELEIGHNLIETVRELPLRPEDPLEAELSPAVESGSASNTVAPRVSEASLSRIPNRTRSVPAIAMATAASIFAVVAIAAMLYFWSELTTLREQYASLSKQTEEIIESMEPPSLRLIPNSHLRSTSSPGDNQYPKIKLRAWMQTFILRLKINERSNQKYSALIERVGQKIGTPAVWRNEFGVENITEQGEIELTLPARDFQAGDYMVTIQGLNADHKTLALYYDFTVGK